MPVRIDENDFIGQKFGRLTVLSFLRREPPHSRIIYQCQCDCGKILEVRRDALQSGAMKSCGNCSRIEREDDHYRYYCHNGRSFTFDECDMDYVLQNRWTVDAKGYATAAINKKTVEFSRLALQLPDELYADHINGNPSNNCRSNLRPASPKQNARNGSIQINNRSGYKGVRCQEHGKPYRADITREMRHVYLGCFDTAEEAAYAYDSAARLFFGEFACVNFPQPGERGCRAAVNE